MGSSRSRGRIGGPAANRSEVFPRSSGRHLPGLDLSGESGLLPLYLKRRNPGHVLHREDRQKAGERRLIGYWAGRRDKIILFRSHHIPGTSLPGTNQLPTRLENSSPSHTRGNSGFIDRPAGI